MCASRSISTTMTVIASCYPTVLPSVQRSLLSGSTKCTAPSSRSRNDQEGLLMRWIVGSSLRFRCLVIFAAAALMVSGIGETRNADLDVFPEFAPPRVEIQTIAVGNSSEQVEELITVPLENQLNGVPGLEEMRSRSVSDLSQIELLFSRDTDLYEARQLVQERLAEASPNLPTWASPHWMMPPLSST